MGNQKLGKIARIAAGVYVSIIGLSILINQFTSLVGVKKSGDNMADLLVSITSVVSILGSFAWSTLWISSAYILFKNKRNNFPTVLTLIILSSLGAVGLGYIIAQYRVQSQITYNPLPMLIFYLLPAALIFICLKNEPSIRESSVERARKILGEHVKHLSDEELHKSLK